MDLTSLGLVVVCMVVVALIVYVMPIIKKWAISKGINISETLITTDKIIELLQLLMKDTKSMPVDQQIFIDTITDTLQKAIQLSQKMYEDGQCTKEERAQKAIELVIDMANAAKITITDIQHEIITKAVQTIILLLP